MRYTAAVEWSGLPTTEQVLGSLDDGYFTVVSATGSPRVTTWSLRHVDDPTTDVDTETVGTYPNDLFSSAPSRNGEMWYARTNTPATFRQLTCLTRSGTSLVKTEVGSSIATSNAWTNSRLTFDGSAFFYNDNDNHVNAARSTTDASLIYSWTKSTGTGGHNFFHTVPMDSSRILGICFTHGEWELWDATTDTLLDSITSLDSRWGGYVGSWTAIGADRAFYAWQPDIDADPMVIDYGVISTAGDTLTVEWSVDGFETNWSTGDATDRLYTSVNSTGTTVAIHARQPAASYPDMSLYIVDGNTGQTSASEASALAAHGSRPYAVECQGVTFASVNDLVVDMNTAVSSTEHVVNWDVRRAAPAILRQRQSPVRTPSRVRGIDLRARQTPYITR